MSVGNCISDIQPPHSWRVKGVRIEISAPDKLVGFLFQLPPVRDGVAMLARHHATRQDFLFQLRPPPPPRGNSALVQKKCVAVEGYRALASHSPVSNRSPPTLPGRPIHVQRPSVSPRRPMGWVEIFNHFLSFRRQTCCQHNRNAGATK